MDLIRQEYPYLADRAPVVDHVSAEDIKGKVVLGVLPLHLAAEADMVIEVPLNLPAELRGKDLTVDEMRPYVGKPVAYRVRKVEIY